MGTTSGTINSRRMLAPGAFTSESRAAQLRYLEGTPYQQGRLTIRPENSRFPFTPAIMAPVSLGNTRDVTLLRALAHNNDSVLGAAFSHDGRKLASACWGHAIKSWEVDSGRLLRTLSEPGAVRILAFSPDATILTSWSADGSIRLWGIAP